MTVAEGHRLFRIVGKLFEDFDGISVDAEGVFEARVGCSGVDQGDESKLGYACESSERGGIDQSPNPGSDRDIEFRGDPDHGASGLQFRNQTGRLLWSFG